VIYLVWGNSNPTNDLPFIITDIWSTTNLSVPFQPRFRLPPYTNLMAIYTTNRMELFIARFAKTNEQPWQWSEWSAD